MNHPSTINAPTLSDEQAKASIAPTARQQREITWEIYNRLGPALRKKRKGGDPEARAARVPWELPEVAMDEILSAQS